MRLALLASGRGSNVAAIVDAVASGKLPGVEPVILLCDRAGAPVIDLAGRAHVPVAIVTRADHPSREAWDAAVRTTLTAARPDLVALAGFGAILGPAVIAAFPNLIVNIHPSLLPAFGGLVAPGPQAAALAAGVSVSGCTVHVVTASVDDGPIVAQAEVPVLPDDTAETLSARILEAEHRLYPETIAWFAAGRIAIEDGSVRIAPPSEEDR